MFEHYIGIENELVSFKGNKQVSFAKYFDQLRKPEDYAISDHSIRTPKGLGFYMDGNEIEILTPPIPINKGFATRLTDSLMIGREKVLKATPSLNHTGFSMHWNLSRTNNNYEGFLQDIAVPFHLFGLTPLSIGLNVREKTDEHPSRIEILGDSLLNEDQINATALFLGSYSFANSQNFRIPFVPVNTNLQSNLFLPDGRYSFVDTHSDESSDTINIQAQQYLEMFYQWIEPFVNELGTETERENLEDFIFRKKPLEFDSFKYFSRIFDEKGKDGGSYLPIKVGLNGEGQILTSDNSERKSPLECLLLGEIVRKKKDQISSFKWDTLELKNGKEVSGIDKIYTYAHLISEISDYYRPAIKETDQIPGKIGETIKKKPIIYNPERDTFRAPKENFLSILKGESKRALRRSIWNWLLIGAISVLIGGLGSYGYNLIEKSKQKNSLIQQYEKIKIIKK